MVVTVKSDTDRYSIFHSYKVHFSYRSKFETEQEYVHIGLTTDQTQSPPNDSQGCCGETKIRFYTIPYTKLLHLKHRSNNGIYFRFRLICVSIQTGNTQSTAKPHCS
jgi:hypothetical protein